MKLILRGRISPTQHSLTNQLLRVMKLCILLLIVTFFTTSATVFSQKITLKKKNSSLSEVFKSIEKQTGVNFFYDNKLIKPIKGIDIDIHNVTIDQALDQLLIERKLIYSIIDQTIVVRNVPSELGISAIVLFDQLKGSVVDDTGLPLVGVNIHIKNNSGSVSTNAQGQFQLTVKKGDIIVFSFIGFNTQEITYNGQNNLTVKMTSSVVSMAETVVVGYATQKKVNITGAVNTVDAKILVNRPVSSLTNALQGAVAGMTLIARPGDVGNDVASINVQGRGNLGTSSPLFVVDGVIVSSGDFARINTNDVESISVLKDASASAIYGSRAAYGVILVSTKKGKGTMKINYNAYYGSQSATILPDWVGSYDYAVLRNEAATNAAKVPVYSASDLQKIQNQSDPDFFPNTNWIDLTLRKSAPIMEHQLSVSGGEKTKYYFGGAYFDQNSIFPGKDLKRFSIRANTETQVSDKFKVGTNISFINDNIDNKNGDVSMTSLNRLIPLIVNKQSDGTWGSIVGGKVDGGTASNNTIRALTEGGRSLSVTNRFIGSVNATYTPIKGLDINGLVSYNFYNLLNSSFINTTDPLINFITKAPIAGSGNATNQLTENWQNIGNLLTQATASYEKNISKHYFKVLAGASYENTNNRTIKTVRKNFVNNSLNAIDGGSSDPLNTTANGGIQQRAFESVFGRLNYAYNNRYLFEASLRSDASSQFAPGHRQGTFPSFSAGWRISQEEFMENVNWVTELKLRGSWGKLGNVNNVGYYDYFDGLTTKTGAILDESKQDGVFPAKLYNPNLSWEKVTVTNFGLDATLFKKLTIQLDVFNRLTTDILLQDPSIPSEAGLVVDPDPAVNEAPSINGGALQNRGVELSLNYNGAIGNFKYSVGGNLSKVKNKITNLLGANETPPSGYLINRVGQPIGSFYMWQSDGLFKDAADVANHAFQSTATKAGDIKYIDQNGDNKIDGDDRVILGNEVPYFTYALNFSASYKNFDFSILGQGVNDVKVYLEQEASQAFFNGAGVHGYVLDRWTAANPNPNAAYPRILISADNTQNLKQSDFWLFNADYFRIKYLTLGYSLPQHVLDKVKIKGLRVYASTNNPFTIRGDKKLKDFDPENASQRASIPQLKTYSFGINLTL